MSTMTSTAEVLPVESSSTDLLKRPAAMKMRQYYRPELDILRFFAFLAVFLHHGIYQLSPTFSKLGAYGLSLFFLLSAFLITELLQREKQATGRISIREFYVRRTLRIWPLYFGFLAFAVGLAVVFPSHRAAWGFLLSFAFMIGNVYIGRHGFPNSPAGFLWSISVEEQFYLFWPLLSHRCGRRTLSLIALCTFPLAGLTIVVLTANHATANIGIWTNSLVEFQFFAFGILLSLGLNGSIPDFSARSRVALLATGIALWLVAARATGVSNVGTTAALGPLIGYYVIGFGCVAFFLGAYGMERRWLPAPILYLGKISYGLYVFHQFSLELAGWILNRNTATASETHHTVYGIGHVFLGFLLTVVAATISYRYFETPFLKLKEKFTIIHARSV